MQSFDRDPLRAPPSRESRRRSVRAEVLDRRHVAMALGTLFLAAALALTATAALAAEAVPAGAEFQVNAQTPNDQLAPAVGANQNGGFLVAWQSDGQDGSGNGIFRQNYDANGAPLGFEFQVNTTTAGNQDNPAAAMNLNGRFVVVWESEDTDGSGEGIRGRRYDATGAAFGNDFALNTYTTGNQDDPSVAIKFDADFVAVWQSTGQDTDSDGIFAQQFNPSGTTNGAEFQVNTTFVGNQRSPDTALDSSGQFAVVWQSPDQDSNGIFAALFDSAGSPRTGEFQVNSYSTGNQENPAVIVGPSGTLMVVWESTGQDGNARGVFGQLYNSSGAKVGQEFQVNSYTTGNQDNPDVAVNPDGDFVAVWESQGQDGNSESLVGQPYDSAGNKLGTEFAVNTYTTGNQAAPALGMSNDGVFVVAWQDDNQDGSGGGIFAQRFEPFCTLGPRADCRDAGKSLFLLRDRTPDRRDQVSFKWLRGEATSLADFADPTFATDYSLCVYDAVGLMPDYRVPASSLKWRQSGDRGFKYKDKNGLEDGMSTVLMRAGEAGLSTVSIKGKGENLPAVELDPIVGLELPVTVQFVHGDTGDCWGGTFTTSIKNGSGLFKAKGPS